MKKILSLVLCATLLICAFPMTAKADSAKIVTLGADLSEEEKTTVLNFFGISDTNSVEIITIGNAMEHEVLGGYISDSLIGTKTYSCAYIEPTNSGGINVRTANLTYVSDATLSNALMTAGIDNCNLIVTAPFPVSGTGALTGVYKAYESAGIKLDSEKQGAATEELILASEFEEEYGPAINKVITKVKSEAVAANEELSDEDISNIIRSASEEYSVGLTEDDIAKLTSLVRKILTFDYDIDSFKTKVNETINTLNEIKENTENTLNFVQKIFKSISDFFNGLFGKKTESSGNSIFDNINTDIFKLDDSSVTNEE